MKKINLNIILVGLLIFILALVSIPFWMGYCIKNQYDHFIFALNHAQKNVQLTITEYHQGWFHSTAKLVITANNGNLVTTINQLIHHGPLLQSPITHQLSFVAGVMQGEIQSSHFTAEINTVFGFRSSISTQITTSPITLPNLSIAGITGDMLVVMKNNTAIDSTGGHLNIGPLIFNAPPNHFIKSLTINSQTLEMSEKNTRLGIVNKTFDWATPLISITSTNDALFNVNHMTKTLTSGMEDDQHFQLSEQLNINKIDLPIKTIPSISNIHLSMILDKLSAAGILALENDSTLPSTLPNPNITNMTLSLFTPQSQLNANVSFNTSLGPLSANVILFFPPNTPPFKTVEEAHTALSSTIKVQAAIPLIDALIQEYANDYAKPVMPITEGPHKNIFNDAVATLLQEHKISLELSLQIIELGDNKLPMQNFSTAIDQLKLSPEVANLLKQQYQLQINTVTNEAIAVNQSSPLNKIDNQLNDAIAKGWIIKDTTKNNYLTTITYQNGVFMMNGKNVP